MVHLKPTKIVDVCIIDVENVNFNFVGAFLHYTKHTHILSTVEVIFHPSSHVPSLTLVSVQPLQIIHNQR